MIVSGILRDDMGLLDGATVMLLRDNERTNVATQTNSQGKFKIENESIEPTDTFEIRYLGLKPVIKTASELQDADIFMEEDIDSLDAVIITSNVGKKPKEVKTQKVADQWYKKPVFVLSVLGLVTTASIIYIIKKTK